MADDEKTSVIQSHAEAANLGAAPAVDDEALPVGTAVGSYISGSLISSGGGGYVYRARHSVLGRSAAVKILRREFVGSQPMTKRFFMEAMAVNMIRHPSIVDVFDVGVLADGRPFLVMEYLEGLDLDSYLRTHGRFTPKEALEILEPVAGALNAAHKAGFVHRDIKPSNVHIGRTPEGGMMVKLLDFGVAKALRPENAGAGLTVAGSRIGTSSTMSPEQIMGGTIVPQTDIYALGVLLFRLLVGRNPFIAPDPRELDRMHLTAPPPRPSEYAPVSTALDAVVARAMAKRPEQRYTDTSEFVAALRETTQSADAEAEAQYVRAVGIHVGLRTAAELPEPDDAALDDMLTCLDIAEPLLSEAGFFLAIQTGSALLGVKTLPPPHDPADRLARRAARTLASTILAAINARPGPHPQVEAVVAMHVAPVSLKQGEGGMEATGGPLLDVQSWAPVGAHAAVVLTADATTGLGPPSVA